MKILCIKVLLIIIVVFVLPLSGALPARAGEGTAGGPIPSVIAKVGGEDISLSELNVLLMLMGKTEALAILKAGSTDDPDKAKELDKWIAFMVDRKLLLKIAWRKKDKLENLVSRMIGEMITLPSRTDGLETIANKENVRPLIKEYMKEYSSESERASFLAELKKYGITLRQVRKKFFEDLMIRIYISYLADIDEYVSPAEIRAYFKANPDEFKGKLHYTLRRIFISAKGDRKEEEAKEIAKKAYGRLEKGEAFEKVAQEMSESPDAKEGGRFELTEDDEAITGVREVLSLLKEGEYTHVFPSGDGYYIIKLEKKEHRGKLDFAETSGKIEARIKNKRRTKKFDDLVKTGRREVPIRIFRHFHMPR